MEQFTSGVGLVLAGGGGKGAYQVGVLKALKENNLLDDVVAISGASIGAINAMLLAMDDIDLMYKVWSDIDILTVFDIDLDMILDVRPFFSRVQLLEKLEKYIDFEKIKNSKYSIYNSICKVSTDSEPVAEYRRIQDYDIEMIKSILLASTALPLVYEAVEIDGAYYRDGGICDNEPIQPLYDAGIRQFIVIGMTQGKVLDTSKWPDASFITIYPSQNIGKLIDGTLDFSKNSIEYRELLGYKDGMRSIKTKFYPDDTYIKMESYLAENDYKEIMLQMKTNYVMNDVSERVNSYIDKFNDIAAKYDKY